MLKNQVFASNYLALHLVRLQPCEEWSEGKCQLCFIFPKGGQGKYSSEAVVRRLVPGDVLVTSAASRGKITISSTGDLVFLAFSVSLDSLFPLFANSEIALLQSITDSFKEARLYPATSPLASECHRLLIDLPPQADLSHRGQLLRIVAHILSQEFKQAHRERVGRVGFVRTEEHLVQVFESLSGAEILNLSVGDLATRFGCSRRHLGRLFHQYLGMSVSALRMEIRMLKAVSLLRNPDHKISTVAGECGFNHLGLFNTCFRKRFGKSPGQWRKTAQGVNADPPASAGSLATCPLQSSGLCPLTAPASVGLCVAAEETPRRRRVGGNEAYAACAGPTQSHGRSVAGTNPQGQAGIRSGNGLRTWA